MKKIKEIIRLIFAKGDTTSHFAVGEVIQNKTMQLLIILFGWLCVWIDIFELLGIFLILSTGLSIYLGHLEEKKDALDEDNFYDKKDFLATAFGGGFNFILWILVLIALYNYL